MTVSNTAMKSVAIITRGHRVSPSKFTLVHKWMHCKSADQSYIHLCYFTEKRLSSRFSQDTQHWGLVVGLTHLLSSFLVIFMAENTNFGLNNKTTAKVHVFLPPKIF